MATHNILITGGAGSISSNINIKKLFAGAALDNVFPDGEIGTCSILLFEALNKEK